MNLLLLIVAFGAGKAIAAQAATNSQLAAGFGGFPLVAAFLSFAVGTLLLGAMAIGTGAMAPALSHLGGQPMWRFAGGLLGAGAIFSTVVLAPKLGLATLLALVIAGQLLTALAIDHFGFFGVATRPATLVRLLGAVVMLSGVLIALYGDRIIPASPTV